MFGWFKKRKPVTPVAPERKPLATLDAAERESISQAKRMTAQKILEAQLVERGLNDLWRAIRDKYQLPAEFEFDAATGNIYKEKS